MLTARQGDFWGRSYVIDVDGQELTRFDPKHWSAGGTFRLDGDSYELRSDLWAGRYALTVGDEVVATAERVGRRRWSVTADGQEYRFERTSFWSGDQVLLTDGEQVGTIRRERGWTLGLTAELPTLPRPVAVFVVAVVLTTWRIRTSAAAGG